MGGYPGHIAKEWHKMTTPTVLDTVLVAQNNALTIEEQLTLVVSRLGAGDGALEARALLSQIAALSSRLDTFIDDLRDSGHRASPCAGEREYEAQCESGQTRSVEGAGSQEY